MCARSHDRRGPGRTSDRFLGEAPARPRAHVERLGPRLGHVRFCRRKEAYNNNQLLPFKKANGRPFKVIKDPLNYLYTDFSEYFI